MQFTSLLTQATVKHNESQQVNRRKLWLHHYSAAMRPIVTDAPLSGGPSVGHTGVPRKNGWSGPDAIKGVDSGAGKNRISDPPPPTRRSTSEGDMPSSQYTQSYSQGGSTWQCSLNLLSLRPKADTHYTTHSISVSYSTKNYNQTIYKYHQKNDELTSSAAKSTKASCRLRTSKRAALLSKTTKRWWTGLLCQWSKWCSAAKNTNSHGMDGGNLINTMEKWKSLTTSKCFNYAFHQNS